MAAISKLTSLAVLRIKERGRYGDGGGLWLQVSKTGTKSWLFRFMLNCKSREMGLGSINTVSLSEAREKARGCRKLVLDGIDPIQLRSSNIEAMALQRSKMMTFNQCIDLFLNAMSDKWKNEKHRAQWRSTLETYASPIIGSISIREIDTGLVLRILEPMWKSKTETASRVRGRIEAVLDYGTAKGWRAGENPARWRGHLDKLLAKPTEIKSVKHHAALPFDQIKRFATELRSKVSLTARALELLMLTAVRPGELVGASWSEVNFQQGVWTIPAVRMKTKVLHRVPLSPRAIELLTEMENHSTSAFVFPGLKGNGHLTTASLLKLVKEMNPDLNLTAHGIRSSFRDWASECTDFSSEVVEMALAHRIKSKVEAAYRRGDLFYKRQALMNDWAKFCLMGADKPSAVINLNVRHA